MSERCVNVKRTPWWRFSSTSLRTSAAGLLWPSQLICTSCLFPGATDSVTKYFLQSQAAEARANASTIEPGSAVEIAAALRLLTEDKLNRTTDEYLRRHTEHAQRLDDLAGELQTLDLSEISHKVQDHIYY